MGELMDWGGEQGQAGGARAARIGVRKAQGG